MHFRIVEANSDYVPALKNKELHLVGFAELGMAYFRDYLVDAFGYKLEDAIRLCERINRADETGTIYPQGCLTGLPVRFFRAPLDQRNILQFRACLRDAFVANRDHCKSHEMVFHYACAISNRDQIIDETLLMAGTIDDDSALDMVTIVADSTSANTALQRTAFGSRGAFTLGIGGTCNGETTARDNQREVRFFRAAGADRNTIMTTNWLQVYLIEAARKKLCTMIYCTTCGAMEFRLGVLHALTSATGQPPRQHFDRASSIEIARALSRVTPDDNALVSLEQAVRCLLFDLWSGISVLGNDLKYLEVLLAGSWAGDVLRRMKEHHEAQQAARRAAAELQANALKRRGEQKRLKQEQHEKRLAIKKERDRLWREKKASGLAS